MKTITLKDNPLSLTLAIQWLEQGKCLGIKPGDNATHMVLQNPERGPQRLVWERGDSGTMMTEQITGEWYPVIAVHRTLKQP